MIDRPPSDQMTQNTRAKRCDENGIWRGFFFRCLKETITMLFVRCVHRKALMKELGTKDINTTNLVRHLKVV